MLADELLELSKRLVEHGGAAADQATLRRAVSTAYYALFHLLISEATLNWGRSEYRPQLGRLFEHGSMKRASEKVIAEYNKQLKKKPPVAADDLRIQQQLQTVAEAFIELQEGRIEADYVTSRVWQHDHAILLVDSAARTFDTWTAIRTEPASQAYLVSMLGK